MHNFVHKYRATLYIFVELKILAGFLDLFLKRGEETGNTNFPKANFTELPWSTDQES